MDDYEEKFTLLSREIERLNLVLKVKTEQHYALSERLRSAEKQANSKKEENEYLISHQLRLN